MMLRDLVLKNDEVLNDIKIGFRKYRLSLLIILTSLLILVLYSQLNYSVDNQITKLNMEKNYYVAENFKLKNQLAVLSSPERISKLAKEQGGMKNIDYRQVKFIDVNE
ncbi:septation ring formation regulator EzrA [Sulfurihydrogenibium sp.]|uniref:septation ring formation regulator EzrA n=2 Tax=Sulfurihydrogenibium sp. TaxID=2053621 RepID=UPI003D140ED6